METRLRIAFVKDWHDDLESIAGNKDGILAAIDELAKRHDVISISRFTHPRLPFGDPYFPFPDVILCWGSLDRPWHNELPKHIPALLCFAGGPTTHPFLTNFKHVFVESQVYEDAFRAAGISVSRAFGTNTDLFRPEPRSAKLIDAIYPASFCSHKNIELFARAMGARGLAVGTWNDMDIVSKCHQLGTPVMRKVSSNVLCDLFNMSKVTVVPCGPDGGSQRTVLESMACGVPVVLANDNDKCREFVEESGFGTLVHPIDFEIRDAVNRLIETPLNPEIGRNYVMRNWTHHHYADALEAGILGVLNV